MGSSPPRFAPLAMESLNEAQRLAVERLSRLTRAGLGGPFSIMLRSPGMAAGMIELFEHYRLNSLLDPRLRELATLIVAREWTAQYEWYVHKPAALKAGLAEAVIEDLRNGRRPATLKSDEAIVYDFVLALVREHEVGDTLFDKALALLGEERFVDLIGLVGEYMKVSLVLNVGRVGVPAGEELPTLKPGEK